MTTPALASVDVMDATWRCLLILRRVAALAAGMVRGSKRAGAGGRVEVRCKLTAHAVLEAVHTFMGKIKDCRDRTEFDSLVDRMDDDDKRNFAGLGGRLAGPYPCI
jgi:hypothetical protein